VSVPLESAQRAITTALFPELRPRGPVFAKSGVFQELVGVLIVVSTPIALYGFVLAPDFTTLILGSGWEEAASWASWASVIAALSLTTVPIGAAFEAQGQFRAATWTWLSRTVVILLAVAVTLLTGDPGVAIAGLAAATFMGMLIQFVLATRMGLLDLPRLLRDVWSTLALCLPFVVAAAAAARLPGLTNLAVLAIGIALFAVQVGVPVTATPSGSRVGRAALTLDAGRTGPDTASDAYGLRPPSPTKRV
jgi:O-antigen/teichoic acid export membrane protein